MTTMRGRLFCACVAAVLVAGCGGGGGGGSPAPGPTPPPPVPPQYTPTGKAAAGDTFVHLFEWRWADIARECEVFLGPKGFKGVQISPPSEHAVFAAAGYPWWQRYQTVSYRLNQSRSGTLAEFRDMIQRCRAQGVEIYADVVINHMTAGSGAGSAGSVYTKYNYPDVPYVAADFHPACGISSYQNQFQVQNCELLGLADLKTEDDAVRTKIANYLIALHAEGVAGFRIDAAKHVPAWDLDQILKKVNDAAAAAIPPRPKPYVFLEVINNPNEAVTANQYYGVGFSSGGGVDITEFQYGYRVADAFLGRNGASLDSALRTLSTSLMPSDKAVVFVDNHDNQRADNLYYASTVSAQPMYELAQIYTLAQPHGVVSLMSGYGFDRATLAGRDAGPPGAGGVTQSTFLDPNTSRCTATFGTAQVGQWVCEHRSRAISNMVAFRKATAGAPLTTCGKPDWTFGNSNQIAFCRDDGTGLGNGKGLVAINRSGTGVSVNLPVTNLPNGFYCNVAQFDFTPASGGAPASCSGTPYVQVAAGQTLINMLPWSAVAIHINARL